MIKNRRHFRFDIRLLPKRLARCSLVVDIFSIVSLFYPKIMENVFGEMISRKICIDRCIESAIEAVQSASG